MPQKIITPEKKRTSQTGCRATTVSMNGIEGLFHCQPCQNPPSHSVTKKPRPPTMHSQNVQFASLSLYRVVRHIRGTTYSEPAIAKNEKQPRTAMWA